MGIGWEGRLENFLVVTRKALRVSIAPRRPRVLQACGGTAGLFLFMLRSISENHQSCIRLPHSHEGLMDVHTHILAFEVQSRWGTRSARLLLPGDTCPIL